MSKSFRVNKNDYIDVMFEDLTNEAAGVAKVDGYPIFVPQALPGERAKIKVVKVNKGYGFGKLIELHEKSPDRVEIDRSEEHKYGGCQLQHMTYDAQLKYKQNKVEQTLKRIGKLSDDVVVHPIISMEEPFYYRNKAQVPVGERDGRIITGFYRPRSHDIIDTDENVLQVHPINEALKIVKQLCQKLNIPAYDEKEHRGVLRHIMVRYGEATGELMIVFVTRSKRIPNEEKLVEEIVKSVPGVKSIIQNINQRKTNVILGDEIKVLWGNEVIYDYIGDVKFAISPLSFYQVNHKQTKVLYEKALEYANLSGAETVIDAYCGIGTISLFLAKNARKVYGVEIVPEAIEDARKNAVLNEIDNAEFTVGEAEKVIPKWAKDGVDADILVVDPPRKGCDESLLKSVIEAEIERIVYVSCNPATLARDLKILEEGGYRTEEVQPVDMFPQTVHVECVALLSRVVYI